MHEILAFYLEVQHEEKEEQCTHFAASLLFIRRSLTGCRSRCVSALPSVLLLQAIFPIDEAPLSVYSPSLKLFRRNYRVENEKQQASYKDHKRSESHKHNRVALG